MRKIKCEFIEVSSLIPKSWDWFFGVISEDAPFSWGDNNRSLVTAECFADHCEGRLALCGDEIETPPCAIREWLKKIRRLGQTYIDLEN